MSKHGLTAFLAYDLAALSQWIGLLDWRSRWSIAERLVRTMLVVVMDPLAKIGVQIIAGCFTLLIGSALFVIFFTRWKMTTQRMKWLLGTAQVLIILAFIILTLCFAIHHRH